MVGASKGVKGLMILTRRVAALPATIVLYNGNVFLKNKRNEAKKKKNFFLKVVAIGRVKWAFFF